LSAGLPMSSCRHARAVLMCDDEISAQFSWQVAVFFGCL
jgi:hypothetical protein